ncbi:MAG: RNA polymerase sigma factor [Solirubrobacterales bacterium]|nr:RNA polymerase sigma factor [Solirubrobacterales bacterium]MBV9534582.1 RNA polymerase sigma factor [Solirubrobacterales bacterium]
MSSPTVPDTIPGRTLDPDALVDRIDRLYPAARRLCGSREEAEDLVQETFVRVLRKPRLLRSEDDLGYLLRAMRNTFISTRRAAARRPRTVAPPDTIEFFEDSRAPQPEALIEASALYAAISALPSTFRDAVVAIDVVGLSYREAAGTLRVREATITTRLHRGRRRVARALSEPIPSTAEASAPTRRRTDSPEARSAPGAPSDPGDAA